MSPRRRVVVTGIGVLCPLGGSTVDLWQGLVARRSGIGPVTRFDPGRFRCRVAGQIDDAAVRFAPGPHDFEIKRMSDFVRHALFAADRALEEGGLVGSAAVDAPARPALPPGGAVFMGVAMGGLPAIEAGVLKQERQGPRKTSPFLILSLIPNMAASVIARRHGLDGPQMTVAGACASGSQAIGHAMRAIESGACAWALAGGAEAVTTPITFSGLEAMRALSAGDPAPRPFDRRRDGMIIGEAAAVFLLEERAQAEARGASIHGELVGYATNSGGDDITGVSVGPVVRCIAGALRDAELEPGSIDVVFAQASGLVRSDAGELEALRAVTGAAKGPIITSIKGHTGYMFAANGPMSLAAALLALRNQVVPPTLHFEEADPPFSDADVAAQPRPAELRRCLVNAFGFGGINASLIVARH